MSQVQIKFEAIIIGVQKVSASFGAPATMTGLCQRDGKSQVDRVKVLKLIKEYMRRSIGRTDCVDLVWTLTTKDGAHTKLSCPSGFDYLRGITEYWVPLVEPPAPKVEKAQAVSKRDRQSKKDVKTGWHEPHDEQDAISDSQLTPKQLERRKRLEQQAEELAFKHFKRK